MTDLAQLTADLLERALSKGADAADAVVSQGTSLSIEVREGALEHAERAEGIEIGIRALVGQRQACVSANDVRPETLDEIAERAVQMARIAPEDPHIGLADAGQIATTWDIETLDLVDAGSDPAPADLEDAARSAESAALAVEGISKVQSAGAYMSKSAIHLAATNGFSGGYLRTGHGISAVAITGEGTDMERDYFGETRVYRADVPDPETVGRIAAERTLARAGARKPPTGTFPVLYDERVASSLIGHLLQAANGASVARGASWLMGRIGEQVLPDGLSIVEDPHRVRVGGSRPFDGEGLPTAKRTIVENGVLQGWTLDLATARKLGMESTASASRGPSAPPSPTTGNIALTPGAVTRDDLVKDMGTGLLVTSMIGSTVNPTTGDYSRGASGFWVENGEIRFPVNECTIAGNLIDMLKTIVPANDGREWTSRVIPSLLVEGLTIAGD